MKSFLLKRYNYSLSKIIYEEKMNICYYSDKILTPKLNFGVIFKN